MSLIALKASPGPRNVNQGCVRGRNDAGLELERVAVDVEVLGVDPGFDTFDVHVVLHLYLEGVARSTRSVEPDRDGHGVACGDLEHALRTHPVTTNDLTTHDRAVHVAVGEVVDVQVADLFGPTGTILVRSVDPEEQTLQGLVITLLMQGRDVGPQDFDVAGGPDSTRAGARPTGVELVPDGGPAVACGHRLELTRVVDGHPEVWVATTAVHLENLGDAGSAASAAGEFGIGILMHRSQAPWRRNFSFAHELFHLVTRDSIEQDQMRDDPRMQEWVEKLAESFAANLLLPEDVLIGEIDALVQNNKISYGDLISLARDFDTSTSALVWRLVNCKRLSTNEANRILQDDNFKAADRSTMAGKWSEPAPLSERFVRLAFRAFKKERVSRSRLAQLLGTSLFDLDSFLSDYGFQEADDYEAEATVA